MQRSSVHVVIQLRCQRFPSVFGSRSDTGGSTHDACHVISGERRNPGICVHLLKHKLRYVFSRNRSAEMPGEIRERADGPAALHDLGPSREAGLCRILG